MDQVGCFERYASMKILKDKISKKKGKNDLSGKEIYEIMKKDKEVKEILDKFIKDLNIRII